MEQTTIHDILHDIRLKAQTEREKGTDFERLMKLWFMTDPRYSNLEKVWLWEEFPGRKDFGGKDLGIDLVARTEYGDYWAIQCKCYAEDATIDKAAVDSFLANASRTFLAPETFQTQEFSNLVWVQTSRKRWGANAEIAIHGLSKPFNRISLYDLENSPVDWDKLKEGIFGKAAKLSGKNPRKHQLEAMSKAREHFIEKGNERGKLIMACGTGKTYTALNIVETMTEPDALVLFLVPSIALLGQTLNAWMADKKEEMRAICVCSDSKVTRQTSNEDDEDASVVDLAVPATTNVHSIVRQLRNYGKEDSRIVIFSTYQSIDVVKDALDAYCREVDLIICDEAHRTTGVIQGNGYESNFTKVHNNQYIRAFKRLYMTATPRLYRDSVKVKAKENDDVLCSMDDVTIYGEEFHRLSFNDAVSQGLLTDYKVLVLTVSEEDIPSNISEGIKLQYQRASRQEKLTELQFDDATKLIGCINGLSKRIKGDGGITKEQDPLMMKRAVAFCQTINPTKSNPNYSSTMMAQYMGAVSQEYKYSLPDEEQKDVVNIQARHIDGSMDANTRNELIAWLKQDADDPGECRVLCNVRCLSEGVDVPALDAVIFLSPRNSEVEVVQSVGRVMRSFGKGTDKEKKYGYIIIPVIVPKDVTPEEALNDNERFKVVWTILNALRSHDENFNAHVNQINLNRKRTPKITVGGVPRGSYTIGQGGDAVNLDSNEVARQLELRFGELQDGIYARLVEKVGDKMYWENWAKSVGEIARKFIERIARLIKENDNAREYFEDFISGLHKNINDSIDEGQAIEMLAQHMITRPVFDALFKEYQFVKNNAVSRAMQQMVDILEAEGMEMDTVVLENFYTSVRNNVSNIDNLEGKQTIIKNLYEKFFKGAFPKTVEQLGIVYTPVECVDFIIHSVEDILKAEFGTSLTEENVHILDPFTGTGTFITRLLQSGLIRKEDMLRKYKHEIHCNEIVLLAYYVADVNIEAVFHDIMQPEEYHMFNGICLTDTFQLNEHGENDIFSQLFPENSERVLKQKKAPVRVIIGNPPYSKGQKDANDNAQNLTYPQLDNRIISTYRKQSKSTSALAVAALRDSYIKAFRWASDRLLSTSEGGIVAFISNGAWLDGISQDGMRKCLQDEFTSIYVLNLRGNQRTSGELSRKEGGKIFGSGSRTPITITFLVKNPAKQGKATIHYHDIGDYLTREQKLKMVRDFHSIDNVKWTEVNPNEKHDWLNLRDGAFENMIQLTPDKKYNIKSQSFFSLNYLGVVTARDAWAFNYSSYSLNKNVKYMMVNYNSDMDNMEQNQLQDVEAYINTDNTRISWTAILKNRARKGFRFDVQVIDGHIRKATYRPFMKSMMMLDKYFNEVIGLTPSIFPTPTALNKVFFVSGIGANKDFSVFIVDTPTSLDFQEKGQGFPLYWYEENKNRQKSLFDAETGEDYIRRDGITDWILKEVRSRYGGAKNITKEMIFYYVYGLLHSPDYRERFASDLKKSLPRIPIVERVEDFMDFYKCGKKLADLHLNYEEVPPCPDVMVQISDAVYSENYTEYDHFRVEKMRFGKHILCVDLAAGEKRASKLNTTDKSTIIYNGNVIIGNIPEKAYEYVVNGKSAIEWIVERYCVNQDKKSLIVNDANDWGREHGKPRYILDLLLSVINVSVQTVEIVKALPKLKFD